MCELWQGDLMAEANVPKFEDMKGDEDTKVLRFLMIKCLTELVCQKKYELQQGEVEV